jgi:mercuric reductase
MNPSYDMIILGSGTSAFAAARKASSLGARVLMVEQSRLGGTCVNWGCVPSKTLIHHASEYAVAARLAAAAGDAPPRVPDGRWLLESKERAVKNVRQEHYQSALDDDPLIDIMHGRGRFLSPHSLQVGDEILTAERFLVATGGYPRGLALPGLEEAGYLNSYSALNLTRPPASLLILGGGVIAVEMGQMFARFGTRVTIIERGRTLLREFDRRLTRTFAELLHEDGVSFEFEFEAREIERHGDQLCLRESSGGADRCFTAERLMLAVGTAPATRDIGLDKAGIDLNAGGFIQVDSYMRTSAENIWAAGDVTGPPLIAPAGAREGEVAAINMLDPEARRRIDHHTSPMAVFVEPELASVGINARQAVEEGIEADESYFDLSHVAKAHVMGGRRGGFVLTAARESGRLLGAQILAPRAADIIHQAALAVRCGLTVRDLSECVHAYPTIADGLRLAALEHARLFDVGSDRPNSSGLREKDQAEP